ncbi:glycosyltransferase family 2 protein [Agreia sp. COWG]|uniref:glycosyltransferase family 2 protein n=1 Tax=Agreia sp. COWG TaxID=2773266 RepID=UPI00192659EB|nr:galactosyltransferase-related protein [Agreia sp. COWG]CAD6003845.1 Sugar transferase [Agreia sp. COWG]
MSRVAVITIVHGRHEHLALQRRGLGRSLRSPDDYIVVAIDDDLGDDFGDEEVCDEAPAGDTLVLAHPGHPLGLPLAAARNAGARAALDRGADVLVFLDVDCIPDPALLGAYEAAAADEQLRDDILCGPVAYLPPPPGGGYDLRALDQLAAPHAARPAPEPGRVERGGDPDLFWSLSFALTASTWLRIGGFFEEYAGYGGEDTDFSATAASRGIELAWIGAARAYHQYHPTETPPVSHLDDIVRNATLFHSRWARWPMAGWLDGFESAGLVRRNPHHGGYELVTSSPIREGSRAES